MGIKTVQFPHAPSHSTKRRSMRERNFGWLRRSQKGLKDDKSLPEIATEGGTPREAAVVVEEEEDETLEEDLAEEVEQDEEDEVTTQANGESLQWLNRMKPVANAVSLGGR